MRKKIFKNTSSSLVFQLITIISGFVLPKLILTFFGSETNGLLNSITQFLQIISFLELGLGAVVQSALYKPLANNDIEKMSRIVVSANNFFNKIARILIVYVLVLIFAYPLFVDNSFSMIYISSLIIATSINLFSQYYFGMVNMLLLTADQKGYVQYNVQSITIILNVICTYFLVINGYSIQVVKYVTAIIYLCRPLFLKYYVARNYSIDYNIEIKEEPIEQKWNGVAQHVASVVLNSSDTIILSLFGTLEWVSIYSVYYLVVNGVKILLISLTNGIQAVLGELLAKKDYAKLNSFFGFTEWGIHNIVVFIFGCTANLIIPFVYIYTLGVEDGNYILPSFAILMVTSTAIYCIRLPYSMMILAGGHYRQTQKSYFLATAINVISSIIFVKLFGLIGVSIGTLITMIFQTFWMAWYNSKNLLNWPLINFFKQISFDFIIALSAYTVSSFFVSTLQSSIIGWVTDAVITALVWGTTLLIGNIVIYREKVKLCVDFLLNKYK